MRPLSVGARSRTTGLSFTGHQPGLDGVRGLAILMVLVVHFVGGAAAQTTLQRLVVKASGYGLLGVDLFFVLSGFLITGLLIKAKGHPNYFRNFYARRTLRIFPLYYGVLAVLFLLLPRLSSPSPMMEEAARHQAWLWTYTSNFYIASISSWNSLTYVNHFWSLAVEEHFYLLWPLVVFSVTRPTLERVCIGVIVAGLVLRIALAMHGMSELSISVLTPCRVDTLCVGGWLAALANREDAQDAPGLLTHTGRAAVVTAVAVLVVSLWCATTDLGLAPLHQIRNTLYAFFFGTIVVLSLRPATSLPGRLFQNQTLRFLGKYSYGLYVYHAILLWYFTETGVERRVDAWLGNHAATMVVVALAGTGISIAVAVASYHLFEKHLLALKRFFETAGAPAPRQARAVASTAAR